MAALREAKGQFLGVNLRHDPLSMADGDVIRAINADFHAQPGIFRRRAGIQRVGSLQYGSPLRLITRQNDIRYIVGNSGSLYENETLVLTGLSGEVTSLVAYQPFNDSITWTFIANAGTAHSGMVLKKISNGAVSLWGIVGPSTAPTLTIGAAGSLTGDYGAVYTYVRLDGTAIAHESTPSPLPVPIALAAKKLDIAIKASTDPQVNAIRIYRTVANGALYFFDQQVSNATQTVTSQQPDLTLGDEVELDNSPPPVCGWAAGFQQHIFLCNQTQTPNALFYSKRFRPESFPASQYLLLGLPSDPLQCAIPSSGMLGVFSRDTKYRVFGNATSGFTALEALSTRGTIAPMATLSTSEGVVFVARDGLWATNFVERDMELSQALAPLFYGESVHGYAPIDFTHVADLSVAEYRRRLFFSYQDTLGTSLVAVFSRDTQRWYHYQMQAEALAWEERTDLLLFGGGDGYLYKGETGEADRDRSIAMEVSLPIGSMQDRFMLKRYVYLRTDIDTAGDGVYVDIYVDNTLRTTVRVAGDRDRRLRRLPPGLLGTSWQAVVRSTGKQPTTVYALDVLANPLEYA